MKRINPYSLFFYVVIKMVEEIKAQILHRIPTPSGLVTHGMQFDYGTHQSNIICVLCQNQNKLTTNKTLKQHARHVLNEHSEIFKPAKSAKTKTLTA
jgi:hypothetical protein